METPVHRRIDVLLARYAESHQHRVNELMHCVCVPAIVLALLGLLWAASPVAAVAVVVAVLVYYLTLSSALAAGMLVMASAMLLLLAALPAGAVLPVSAGIFVVAWIGQFAGHHIEGKKPSFLEDIRFLLIGPLFVLRLLYRTLHIRY